MGLVPEVIPSDRLRRPDNRSRLRNGERIRALFVSTSDGNLCELVALLGWEILIVDGEHGAVTPRDMENIARACERRGVAAGVRVPMNAPAEVGRYLDAGATVIMFPMVEGLQQVEQMIRLVRYSPEGHRGVAAPRCADFGLRESSPEELARANRDVIVVAQIETVEGVAHADAIASVNGVDALFVGPADLSVALGAPSRWDSVVFESAVDKVARAASQAGKTLGAYAGDRERTRWYEAKGARLMAAALEDLIILGSQSLKE